MEVKRTRLECEANIFDQMTSVFDEILTPAQTLPVVKTDPVPAETVTVDGDVTIVHIADTSEEMKVRTEITPVFCFSNLQFTLSLIQDMFWQNKQKPLLAQLFK